MKKNVKQLLSALLVIAMMATLLIVPAAAAGKTEVDVWDFGAEQLADTEQYQFNNQLTVEEINSWYPAGTTAGSDKIPLPSFTSKTGIAFDDGGFPTTHRLRTTNKALTRQDDKSLKGDGSDPYITGDVTYTGYIYSNKSGDSNVYLKVTLEAGDILTAIVSRNNGNSTIAFEGPSGVEATDEYTGQSSGSAAMTFYAKESGDYKLYSTNEKLVVARLYRQHATEVTVSGAVDAPAEMPVGYSLVFTNTITGAETEATPAKGQYTVTLLAPYTYEVSLKGADAVAVETGKTVEVPADSDKMTHDVKLKAIDMVTVSGTITGLDAKQLEKMGNDLLFTPVGPDVVYIPKTTVTAEGGSATYTIKVEKGRETNLSALRVNDSYISNKQTSGLTFDSDTKLDITFEKKTTYPITIEAEGIETSALADATFVFTNLDEGGATENQRLTPYSDKNEYHYVYTITGTDGIALRDGTYNVAVTTTAGTQKLTSNLVVKGAAVAKTIKFTPASTETPTHWVFTAAEFTAGVIASGTFNQLLIEGNVQSEGAGKDHAVLQNGGKLRVPVDGPCTVTVKVYWSAAGTVGVGEDTVELKTTESTNSTSKHDSISYEYKGEGAGYVDVIATGTTYVTEITVESAAAGEEKPFYGPWDLKAGPDVLGSQIQGKTDTSQGLGIDATTGKWNPRASDTQVNAGLKVTVPVDPAANGKTVSVKVTFYPNYRSPIKIGETTYGEAADADELTIDDVAVADGSFTMEFTANCYLLKIEVTNPYATESEPEPVDDIVLKVGKGQTYQTITDALNAAAAAKRAEGQRITIEIDPGNYEEQLEITVKDLTLKNAAADQAKLELTGQGVDIGANEVRITWYYGHGYNYYSMTANSRYSEDALEVNLANGYVSHENKGGASTDNSYWNASVIVAADGFQAEGIIFENSFNQYVSEKSIADKLEAKGDAKEGSVHRADMEKAGDTTVQDKAYVERAAALAIKSGSQIFFDKCAFVSRQDTLYGQEGSTAAFYDCDVYGGTDYIFGGMTAVFAKCDLVFNTSDASSDVGHITAPQQKSADERGYLMYNCHVTSTVPGENTASTKVSKPGTFGRPWQSGTGEAVFYATDVDATDPSYYTGDTAKGTSMIQADGWNRGLSGESARCGDYGTVEYYEGADTSAERVDWAAGFTEAKTADGQSMEDYEGWLGGWDPFVGKDMTVKNQTPQPFVKELKVTPETLELKVDDTADLTATVTPAEANATVYWTTEDTNVITLSADKGEKVTVTAVAKGTATITAKAGDKTVDVAVTVEDKGQTPETTYNITITPVDGANITTEPDGKAAAGDEVTVTVTVTNETKEVAEVTYKVENDTQTYQATKGDDGKYTFTMPEANVTVTATLKDKEGQGGDVPEEIAVRINTSKVTVKKTVKLSATVTPADAEYDHLYWVSDDTDVLTVDNTDGTATGVKAGKATVHVYVLDDKGNTLAEAEKEITVSNVSVNYGGGGSTTGQTTTPATTKTNSNGDTVKTETKSNGDKTVTVTDKDGNVLVTLQIPAQTPDLGYKFTDVPDDHWAEPSIQAMAAMKVFQGVSTTGHIFDMNSAVTRGTMAQILFNLSQGKTGMTNSFADVAAGAWYTDAIAWAAGAGVVNGVSDTSFAPDASITREQLVTMLYRYAQLLALDTKVTADMGKFVDAGEIDTWASEAMTWAVGKGLIIGKGAGTLDPKAAASRAEAAVIIDRFLMLAK